MSLMLFTIVQMQFYSEKILIEAVFFLFQDTVTEKNQCLQDAQRKLTHHFRQQQTSSDANVRDRVGSQILCSSVKNILKFRFLKLVLFNYDRRPVWKP